MRHTDIFQSATLVGVSAIGLVGNSKAAWRSLQREPSWPAADATPLERQKWVKAGEAPNPPRPVKPRRQPAGLPDYDADRLSRRQQRSSREPGSPRSYPGFLVRALPV